MRQVTRRIVRRRWRILRTRHPVYRHCEMETRVKHVSRSDRSRGGIILFHLNIRKYMLQTHRMVNKQIARFTFMQRAQTAG